MRSRSKINLSQRISAVKAKKKSHLSKSSTAKSSSSSSLSSLKKTKNDPTVLDLMRNIDGMSLGGPRKKVNVKKYMNRNVLKISKKWSKAASSAAAETAKNNDDLKNSTRSENDYIRSYGLSTECATLEVEAITLLAAIEHGEHVDEERFPKLEKDSTVYNIIDDNAMKNELQNLSLFENKMREEIRLAMLGK